jgi:hypothetical protein
MIFGSGGVNDGGIIAEVSLKAQRRNRKKFIRLRNINPPAAGNVYQAGGWGMFLFFPP